MTSILSFSAAIEKWAIGDKCQSKTRRENQGEGGHELTRLEFFSLRSFHRRIIASFLANLLGKILGFLFTVGGRSLAVTREKESEGHGTMGDRRELTFLELRKRCMDSELLEFHL